MNQEPASETVSEVVSAPGTVAAGGDGRPPEALAELRAFLVSLLETQCALVGASAGVAYFAKAAGRHSGAIASVLANGDKAALSAAVLDRAERLASEVCEAADPISAGRIESIILPRKGSMYGEEQRARLLASPLSAEGRVEGACVLLIPPKVEIDGTQALRLSALAAARFEAFLWRRQCLSEAEQKAMLRQTVELLDAAQQGESAPTMGAIMCDELRRRFACSRVSIGLIRRDLIRLTAVSGADEIERTAPAVETIENAMEECAAQDAEIIHPAPAAHEADPAQRRVARAHEELNRRFGPSSILSLPLRVDGDLVGVLLLERPGNDPFPPGAAALLRLVAETIGPALWTRRLADRGIFAVTRDRIYQLGETIVGPRHTGAKLLALLVLLAFVASLIPVPSRVGSTAEVRAQVSRLVAPPFSGYLSGVRVRPGDRVEKDQVIATMDTSELTPRLAEAEGRLASYEGQRDEALGKGDQTKARMLAAQADETRANIALLRDHIARAEIRAPIAGLIGKGDLEQLVNARVDPTQPLMDIVADTHKVVIFVAERDVQRVRAGQTGRLALKSRPGVKIPVRVLRINPAAEVVRGSNVYETEAELLEQPGFLRPGLTGSVKLDDGWTTTLTAVLRPVADELRLKLWW